MKKLFLLLILIVGVTYTFADCTLNLKDDFTNNHPLLLSQHDAKWVSLTSSPKGYVKIGRSESVRLACPSKSKTNKNFFTEFKNLDVITAKCKSGNNFEVNRKTISFEDLECDRPAEAVDKSTKKECLGKDTELISVGFEVGNEFVREYDVCFNKKEKSTLYTEVTVPETIDKSVNAARDHTWVSGTNGYFESIQIDSIYNCETQKVTFKRILNKDFFGNNRCCVDKSSLVSSGDVVFLAEQAATANYLNAVPQWSTCNRVNWKEIEKRVRNLATSLNRPLTVWTGTYRNMKLAANWGFSHKEMYLHYVDSTHKGVPVPLYIWKVVFDQQTQKGVAIVEINNPHITLSEIDSFVLCEDKCHNINWLNFLERKTIINGYIYCCDLHDFEFGFAFKNSPFPRASGGILRDDSNNRG